MNPPRTTIAGRRDAGSPPGASEDRRADPAGKRPTGWELALWIMVLVLPLAALGLLLAAPRLNMRWEHHPSHFWLVLAVAVVNVVLGLYASEAASRRDDARTFFVSMTLLTSAGFLGLHALATPGVLLDDMTAGFSLAARVGLLVAAGFAALSALDPDARVARAFARHRRLVRVGLGLVLVGWAIASLARVPLLDRPLPPDDAPPLLRLLALAGVALYAIGAVRYAELYRRRRRPIALAVLVAFFLMAEAMMAVVFAHSWHAVWWEWHLLMAVAFGAILAAARVEYRREGSLAGVFGGIYLDSTLRRIDRHDAQRLAEVLATLRSGEPGSADRVLARFRQQGMSAEEAAMLARSARELRRGDALFRQYVAPQLAATLERQPERAQLGGQERQVSVLFADLAGFTGFSEQRPASEVLAMLNRYWAVAVPAVVDQGGLVERFAGDAMIVVFNAVAEQPDHAVRAARAALAIRSGTERLAAGHPGWPRFRIAVNSGPAVVGNVGADVHRSFTVIGDTINLAARLQATAAPGEVVVGPATRDGLRACDCAVVVPLGAAELKGKREPVPIYRLESVAS
jgi:adenylate cyclase